MNSTRTAARLLGWLAAASISLGACTTDGEAKAPAASSTDPAAQNYEAPPLPHATVILQDAFGGSHAVDVEVAATEPARTRGLMWRTELPEGKGMLFVFATETWHSFWMRNTLIPLDMAFIDEAGTIIGIVANAEPKTLTSRAVDGESKYVLEVPGGWFEKIGVRAGSKVRFVGVSQIPVE